MTWQEKRAKKRERGECCNRVLGLLSDAAPLIEVAAAYLRSGGSPAARSALTGFAVGRRANRHGDL